MTTQMTTTFGTYTIPELHYSVLHTEVERLNRRAEKLGVQPLFLTISGEEMRERSRDGAGTGVFDKWLTVVLAGEPPMLGGWQFAATLQHEFDGNLVLSIPGFNAPIPPSYRGVAPWCDHCKTTRQRTDTYLVYSETDGFRQVGSSCLRDFLGHKSPHQVAAWLQDIEALRAKASEDSESFSGRLQESEYIGTAGVVALAAASTRTKGWLSKARVRDEGGIATADYMYDWLFSFGSTYADELREEVKLTDADRRLGESCIAWVRDVMAEREELSDYESNLVIACSGDYTNKRNIAILASALIPYDRAQTAVTARTNRPESQWVGEVGKRSEFTVRVLRATNRETEYGLITIYTMEDLSGNTLKWFASGMPVPWTKLEERAIISTEPSNKVWKLRGRVKSHGEWQGRKETVITRCQVVDEAS